MTACLERIAKNNHEVFILVGLVILYGLLNITCPAQEPSNRGGQVTNTIDQIIEDPFIRLIAKGETWMVSAVLEKGHPVNVAESSDLTRTPILAATFYERPEIVKVLIKFNADLEAKDKAGLNALMYACYRQNLELAKLLATNGAKANSQANGGTTPLLIAAHLGNAALVNLLLQHGADVKGSTDLGATALMVSSENKEVLEKLVNLDLDVNAQDNNGWTALFHAIDNGQLMKIDFLLRHGADKSLKDKAGRTPLMLAINEKNRALRASMVKLLH